MQKHKNYLSLLLILVSIYSPAFAVIAPVDFDHQWQLSSQAEISNGELIITGQSSQYQKAQLLINVPSNIESLYFGAQVKLKNIIHGPQSYHRAKFKILDTQGNKIQVTNINEVIEGQWLGSGIYIPRFDKLNLDAIIIEVAMQNLEGSFTLKSPVLSESLPKQSYHYPYPSPQTTNSTISIDTTEHKPFNNQLLSVNSHFAYSDIGYEDSRIQDLHHYLALPQIRFPAGTVGNFYNWQSDAFYTDDWTFTSQGRKRVSEKGFKFGFDDYTKILADTGASAHLMFNVIHDSIEKSTQRLKNRLSSGIKIDWVEYGNENYYSEQSFGLSANINDYIKHTKQLDLSLKALEPTIKTAVNIDHHSYLSNDWSHHLANESYYDATVLHSYINVASPVMGTMATYQMLNSYKVMKQRIEQYKQYFDVPMLVSEWGVAAEMGGNYIQTLATADMFFALIEGADDGTVAQAGIHQLYSESPIDHFLLFTRHDNNIVASAKGIIYKQLIDSFKGKNINSARLQSTELIPGLPSVNGRAVIKSNGEIDIIAVSKLENSSPLNVIINNEAYSGEYAIKSYYDDPLSHAFYQLNEDPWHYTQGNGQIQLPPLSINVITISPKINTPIDSDKDGIEDKKDNCPTIANSGQWDKDRDSIGNECDADIDGDGCANDIETALGTMVWQVNSVPVVCELPLGPDSDGDGVVDSVDNCPFIINAGQWDKDKDGIGNACDSDIDGDSCNNDIEIALGTKVWNPQSKPQECIMPTGVDSDNDGVVDSADNCNLVKNPGQWDKDGDGVGNECDDDIDGDGFSNQTEEKLNTKVWDKNSYPVL